MDVGVEAYPATESTMRIFNLLATAGAAALLAAAVAMPVNAAEMANTQLKDSSGKAIADVDLVQTPAGVLIKLQIKGLTPGEHAFHVHAVGKCEPPFESAGPHFNPGSHKHGILSGEGHAGDMPNLHVPQSGELSVEMVNSAISLEKGKPNSVFDNDGSALLVHAKADDYKTDPAGNAGDRIACGVIQPSGAGAATVGGAPMPAPAAPK
jgi:Cu-Zn family superoxide dismutase